ncbi:unnamed protein product [Owenia fusiformis]|uniref:Uncharacterized protein n=1 Tax=Owenia fusiformis TaxID=6347 RepID=A0A8S4NRX7_OWEFU|nr:unnamed protein product [Owenia fusiformis]
MGDLKEKPKIKGLKKLLPYRNYTTEQETCPVDDQGFISYISSSFLNGLVFKSYRRPEDVKISWKCPKLETANYNLKRFHSLWHNEVKRKGDDASLVNVFFNMVRVQFILALFASIIYQAACFIGPAYVVRRILEHKAEAGTSDWRTGLYLSLGFITVEILKVFGLMTLKVADIRAGTRLRAVVQAILYEKILRTQSIGNENSGKIISLFANDAARLAYLIFFVASLIAGCVAFVVLAVYSVIYLGPWSLLGIIVFLSNVPIQIGLGKVMATFRMRAITVTDSRVRLISELLKSIRLVKMFAWETSFIQKLNDLRTREIHWIALSMVFYLFGLALGPLLPMFSTGVIFLVKIWTNFPLSAPEAFSILSAIVSMRGAMAELPYSMKILAELTVSLKRFKALMALPDTKQNKRQPNNPECDIEINNATFQWPSMCDATDEELPEIISMKKQNGDKNCHDDERTKIKHDVKDQPVSSAAILSDINLAINKGSLTGICGPIGSGKSTLLYSIMYRTEVVSGELFCNESVTYVPQQPWIMNTTMRENVTFGSPYNKLWYDQVIDACALLQDIEAMPNGDRTEIGERGVTLSGGQKVRLCLARAVYSNKDIYLLDDCLSAVDVRVGQHIFRECIQNILGNKTVVFVTHQLQYLKDTGHILVMDHGRIIEQGSHSQLIESDSTYSSLFRMYCNETTSEKDNNSHKDENTEEQEKETNREENHYDTSDKSDNLMVDEERGIGRVSWSAYRLYINKAGGICLAIILIMIFLLHSCNLVFTSWWLSYWINQGDGQNPIQHANITFEYAGSVANTTFTLSRKEGNILENPKLNFYMGTYGVAVLATLLIAIIKTIIFIKVSCRAATNLHSSMLTKVMFSPMSFFDTNPTGRILNRFSTDVDEVDNQIPKLKFDILDTLFHGFVYLVMICVVIPWALIGIVPTITILWVITMMGGSAVRELKRCENLRRSPLFAHLSNTIQGLQEVQTYGKEEMFKSN